MANTKLKKKKKGVLAPNGLNNDAGRIFSFFFLCAYSQNSYTEVLKLNKWISGLVSKEVQFSSVYCFSINCTKARKLII